MDPHHKGVKPQERSSLIRNTTLFHLSEIDLSSSLDKWDRMDNFGRLPWFALKTILSALPDLPSLHSFHNAAPEVAAFLHQNNGLFAHIVDAIIKNTARGIGLLPTVQRAVRQLVIIWTEQSRRKQSGEDNGQEADPNVLNNLRYLTEYYADIEIPIPQTISPSTPAAVLCRLFALMARLRCLVHASFHEMVARSLQLKIEHLRKKAAYASIYGLGLSNRPQGIPYTPTDVGPLMWIEEQRLLRSFLYIIIFFELRKMYANFQVISVRSQTVHILSHDTVEDFWRKINQGHNNGQREQIATTLYWLDAQAGGRDNLYSWLPSGPVSKAYQYCCPRYTALNDKQWAEEEMHITDAWSSYGALCLWQARVYDVSPLRCVDYAIFRPYGLIFWCGIRMDALGFWQTFDAGQRMWFALSFVLDQKDWDELVIRQQDRSYDPRVL